MVTMSVSLTQRVEAILLFAFYASSAISAIKDIFYDILYSNYPYLCRPETSDSFPPSTSLGATEAKFEWLVLSLAKSYAPILNGVKFQ